MAENTASNSLSAAVELIFGTGTFDAGFFTGCVDAFDTLGETAAAVVAGPVGAGGTKLLLLSRLPSCAMSLSLTCCTASDNLAVSFSTASSTFDSGCGCWKLYGRTSPNMRFMMSASTSRLYLRGRCAGGTGRARVSPLPLPPCRLLLTKRGAFGARARRGAHIRNAPVRSAAPGESIVCARELATRDVSLRRRSQPKTPPPRM